jgi:hypothetical protein
MATQATVQVTQARHCLVWPLVLQVLQCATQPLPHRYPKARYIKKAHSTACNNITGC